MAVVKASPAVRRDVRGTKSAIALAALATEDELGPWLAANWGILADTPPDLLDQMDL